MDSVAVLMAVSKLTELRSTDLKMRSEISGTNWAKSSKESET